MKNIFWMAVQISFLLSMNRVNCQNFSAYSMEKVFVHNGSIKLEASVLIPEGIKKPDVVLLIAGSGPTDMNGNNAFMVNNHMKLLAERLAERNIASMRYNKRIIHSNGNIVNENELRFEDFTDDAVKCLEYLKSTKKFDKIFILGISEGSLIGILAAQKFKPDGFFSVAGAGETIGNILVRQVSAQSESLGKETRIVVDSLKNGYYVRKVNPLLGSLFRPSVQPYLISWLKYDPSKEIARLKCPVLIIQGTNDIQVRVEDAQMLHNAKRRSKLLIIKGMNHIMKEATENREENIKTYTNPDLALHPELVPAVEKFIRKGK
jgi:fermentation-respiration switch protein FrsA (DUF1100 family)